MAEPVVVPVIMSGGAGTRLWPLSTRDKPKQFHALTGMQTLLQQTVLRCPQTRGFAAPVVVCARRHADLARQQCLAVNTAPEQVITEPCPRNTAPCAVTAALAVQALHGDDAQVLLLAADHHVSDADAFVTAVRAGSGAAQAGHIVTFGAQPDHPATGYGYIRRGQALDDAAFAVAAFVEKPDEDTAKSYLAAGDYVWNAGLFLFRTGTLLDEMQRHRPDILEAASAAWAQAKSANGLVHLDDAAFAACPSESLDYAVMEHTAKAAMVPLDAGWSDVGAWPAIHAFAEKDKDGNACHGRVLALACQGNLLHSEGPLIAAFGVNGLAVAASSKAVLVAPLERAAQIKALVEKLDEEER